MTKRLVAGVIAALLGLLVTGYALIHRIDPETMEYVWVIPRDAAYQWFTALGGILLAAGVSFFLPLDWSAAKTERERMTNNICLAVIWSILIYAMARH